MQVQIYNDYHIPVGWYIDYPDTIEYFSYKHGHIGTYQKGMRTYKRWKERPGKPMITMPGSGDYGETDVLYWAERS